MKIDHSAARAVAGGHGEAALLRVLCRFYERTNVDRGGVPVVACRLDDLVEILAASRPTLSRRMKRLEDAGLIVIERGRWNRAPRLFVQVPASTYAALDVAAPPRSVDVVKPHRFHSETSQVSPCNVHVLNTKENLKQNPSEASEAASLADVGRVFSKGSREDPKILKWPERAGSMVKVKDVVIKRADVSKIPLSRLWDRTCREFGYKPPTDDAKNGRHLKLLEGDLVRRGMSVREHARSLIERWPEYRSPDSPKDPLPWAVRQRVGAYAELASGPPVGVYTAPVEAAVAQNAPPAPPPKKQSSLAAALSKKGGGG